MHSLKCTETSQLMKVSITINRAALFSTQAGGCDWYSEAASVGLLPAGRAKIKAQASEGRVDMKVHTSDWKSISKCCPSTEDGHQSAQSIVMVMSIIRMHNHKRANESVDAWNHRTILNDYALWCWWSKEYCRETSVEFVLADCWIAQFI